MVVVRSREGLSAVSESANIYDVPVAVVVCANKLDEAGIEYNQVLKH